MGDMTTSKKEVKLLNCSLVSGCSIGLGCMGRTSIPQLHLQSLLDRPLFQMMSPAQDGRACTRDILASFLYGGKDW